MCGHAECINHYAGCANAPRNGRVVQRLRIKNLPALLTHKYKIVDRDPLDIVIRSHGKKHERGFYEWSECLTVSHSLRSYVGYMMCGTCFYRPRARAPMIIILYVGEVIGFRLFRATGIAFAIRPKDGVARQDIIVW